MLLFIDFKYSDNVISRFSNIISMVFLVRVLFLIWKIFIFLLKNILNYHNEVFKIKIYKTKQSD